MVCMLYTTTKKSFCIPTKQTYKKLLFPSIKIIFAVHFRISSFCMEQNLQFSFKSIEILHEIKSLNGQRSSLYFESCLLNNVFFLFQNMHLKHKKLYASFFRSWCFFTFHQNTRLFHGNQLLAQQLLMTLNQQKMVQHI